MRKKRKQVKQYEKLLEASFSSVLVLDGAMGTMLQGSQIGESLPEGQEGNHELLNLTAPEIIQSVHQAYLEAGAHIIETNTFSANGISQRDFGYTDSVYDMNYQGAIAACKAAEAVEQSSGIPRFTAGSIGPTNRSASLPPRVDDPSYRDITFSELKDAYALQVAGLIDGGVDILLFETFFDVLNCKAALYAAREVMNGKGVTLPIMVSATIADTSGRTLTGQTLGAFYRSVEPFGLFSFGVNCSFGASALLEPVRALASVVSCRLSVHPNAGLPNASGGYSQSPQEMAEELQPFLSQDLVDIVGGCCGTTPEHIQRIYEGIKGKTPPPVRENTPGFALSGLEELTAFQEQQIIPVSEGLNVTGSKRFARLVQTESWDEALDIARKQAENGARIIDLCMDGPMMDSTAALITFLRRLSTEPEAAKLPVMIDSSSWDTIEAGLQNIQGKGIVNSISLKEGDEVFIRQAQAIQSYGASMVVMLFDENGQADSFERKTSIAGRAYQLLTGQGGIAPSEIIIDPNVLACGAGLEPYDRCAKDFIDATAWIKSHLPGVRVIAGITNLSFAYRGSRMVREAMHTVFLDYCMNAGLDLAIIDPLSLQNRKEDYPDELIQLIEDLILCRREYASERLAEAAEQYRDKRSSSPVRSDPSWRDQPAVSRLTYSIQHGIITYLREDIESVRKKYDSAMEIIEGPLMEGMDEVGRLFGEGKVFLPQVVKSARVMKEAAALLQPYGEEDRDPSGHAGRILLATVQGDVHDIGKNLAAVMLKCSRFEVIDLGIMVPHEQIIEGIHTYNPDILGLSGLITPSLEEMIRTLQAVEAAGCAVPVLIGGAATSEEFVETRLRPIYSKSVMYVKDASRGSQAAGRLLASPEKAPREEKTEDNSGISLMPLAHARKYTPIQIAEPSPEPAMKGIMYPEPLSLLEIEQFMNWKMILAAWRMPLEGNESENMLTEAKNLFHEYAQQPAFYPRGIIGLFPVRRYEDDVVVYHPETQGDSVETADTAIPIGVLHFLRRQDSRHPPFSLADFIRPAADGTSGIGEDYLGLFAVTAGKVWKNQAGQLREEGDEYQALLTELLADRVAEACSEYFHMVVRRSWWGYASEEQLEPQQILSKAFQGIRPAVGYPSCPDHSEKASIFTLLGGEKRLGITLTETQAMDPPSSICGYYFASPKAAYFSVGKIGGDQLEDYAQRKGWSLAEAYRWLSPFVVDDFNPGKDDG